MRANMYRNRPEDAPATFIPVVRSAEREAGLPSDLRTMVVLHFPPVRPEDELRRKLLDEIRQTR
jgi:hypothetical protein